MWEKVNLKSSIPVVNATTCLRSAIRNFVALSILFNGQYFKDYHKILWAFGLDNVCSTQWIHIVEWIAPFAKGSPTEACTEEARTEAVRRGDKSSLNILAEMKERA